MNQFSNRKNELFILALVIATLLTFFFVVQAQEGSEPADEEITALGITFPVTELGNCADKQACFAYCNEAEHIDECIAFAQKHGLMNKAEAGRAQKFQQSLKISGGPGGCQSPLECETFCSNINNLETCLSFAEKHGIGRTDLQEGRKILTYIQAGGQMPGGCTSRETCEAYCSDFDHVKECFEFASKAGIGPGAPPGQFGHEGEPDLKPEHLRKLAELAAAGQTPGGCKSKQACETYCFQEGHFEECVEFGVQVGFMTEKEAELVRKTGGKGPGGCSSPKACETYCNDQTHQEECFQFAQEHGFIAQEDIQRMKEGLVQMRAGLEHAPAEVRACVDTVLGSNIVADIEAGKLLPGPQIGERIRACFEQHGEQVRPQRIFEDAPPEVIACIREKIGSAFDEVRAGKRFPTPEMAETFRICFQSVQIVGGQHEGPSAEGFQHFLEGAPPEIAACFKERLGQLYEQLRSGTVRPGPEIFEKVRACFEGFRSEGFPAMPPTGTDQFPVRQPPELIGLPESTTNPLLLKLQSAPPAVVSCLKAAVGEETWAQILQGRQPPVDFEQKVRACTEQAFQQFQQQQPTSGGQVCIQVITPAFNSETKECRQFPTPCEVPPGWTLGCPSQEIQRTEPSAFMPNSILEVIKRQSSAYSAMLLPFRIIFELAGL